MFSLLKSTLAPLWQYYGMDFDGKMMCDMSFSNVFTRTVLISSNLFFAELACKDKGVIYTQISGHPNDSFYLVIVSITRG